MVLPLLDPALLGWRHAGRAGIAVLAFILASAVVYVANDIADRGRDRAHPTKRDRPIAAGRVSPWAAGALAVSLAAVLAAVVGPAMTEWWPLLAYLVVNAAYSFVLKHVPLVDLFVVALGFVLRLAQGYEAVGSPSSGWLTLCVLAVCLLLILGKRRHELRAGGVAHRPALAGYNESLLDHLLVLTAALALITYQLYVYTFSAAALFTVPFALFALFRYLQVVLVNAGAAVPSASSCGTA
ncbi:hypothetical protein Asp14428_22830 [Actinoplanes sp. NBRC 14428]|nr:hypothetical protein Asp14428_22830 [Actinoplanes sp. NBRC 14428]